MKLKASYDTESSGNSALPESSQSEYLLEIPKSQQINDPLDNLKEMLNVLIKKPPDLVKNQNTESSLFLSKEADKDHSFDTSATHLYHPSKKTVDFGFNRDRDADLIKKDFQTNDVVGPPGPPWTFSNTLSEEGNKRQNREPQEKFAKKVQIYKRLLGNIKEIATASFDSPDQTVTLKKETFQNLIDALNEFFREI